MRSGETSVASVTKLLNLDQSMDQHNKIDQHKNNDQHSTSECHLIKCSVRIRLSIPCICLFPFSQDKPNPSCKSDSSGAKLFQHITITLVG